MRHIDGTSLVFVHIPKTAGQAVVRSLGLAHESLDHSVSSERDQRYLEDRFVRFCVVRHPIERFVSAYRYHLHMLGVRGEVKIRMVIAEHRLDNDINAFIAYLRETGYDLQSDLHFRRQLYFLRHTHPQIVLRQENLANDMRIIAAMAPDRYVGLPRVNVSAERARSNAAALDLTQESLSFLRRFYAPDFSALGYGPHQVATSKQIPETAG